MVVRAIELLRRAAALVRLHWVAITTVSALLLAVSVIKGTYVDPGLPDWLYQGAFILALLLLGLLMACLLIHALLVRMGDEVYVNFRCARRSELELLLPLYDELVGGDRPSVNQLKVVHRANENCFIFMERVRVRGVAKNATVIGFCTIVPMNAEASDLLEKNELNGLKFNKDHICSPNKKPKAVYVGSIGAKGAEAKGGVLNYVLGKLDDCADHGIKRVFTRPVTRDGLRIARKYGFEPVDPSVRSDELRELYALDLPREDVGRRDAAKSAPRVRR